MYLLEDGTPVTEEIKTAFKRGLTRAYIKLGNTIISPDNYLQNAKYRDEKADPETGQFIGITSMRELTIKLYNYENTLELENQEVEYFVGALVGNEYKYINFGKFIVQKPENEEVNEETTFTALDYMSKFDGEDKYTPQITFGTNTTLYDLAEDVCRQAGVELGSAYFRNSNMQVLANPFQNGENCRTVLKSIAKVAFSPAYIGQDNKLYIGFDITNSIAEIITTDDFFESKPNDEVKPITKLTLRSSEVKASGQSIPSSQAEIEEYGLQELIDEYGINELIIEEDYLAYTDTLRNAYLTGAAALFGLTYKPLTIDLLGSIYLSFNDVIKVINPQGEEYITYALNNSHEFNGTLYNTISAPALTEAEEKYKYESEDKTHRTKTAIEIDKANGTIDLVVERVDGQDSTIADLQLSVGRLESKISTIADITKPGMTDTAHIPAEQLTDINSSEPITIKVHPIIQNISYLYPMSTLYPNSTLYLKTRTLRFYNSETNENFDCILPCDLFYYDAEHYDDISYEYGDGTPSTRTCIVNKKVGINANGTTYLLNTQTTISYPYPTISLTNGDYIVSLLEYEAGYIYVLLMAANAYTTQYATRIEMNSAITQTAQEIDLSVNQKLTGYSTTTQMNSAINLKANEINLSVSQRLSSYSTTTEMNSAINLKANEISSVVSTKVGKGEIISRINQTSEQIAIDASKINLNGVVTANNYFKINLDGSMETVAGKIANFTISDTTLVGNDGVTGLTSSEQVAFWSGGGSSHAGHHPFEVTRDGNLYVLSAYTWLNNHHVPFIPTLADNFDGVGVQINRIYRNQNTYTFTFEVANSGTWSIQMNPPSDKKLKKNIQNTKVNALDIINKIKFVQFDWKEEEYKKIGFTNFDVHENFGVIADDLEEINSNFIINNKQPDKTILKSVNKQELIYYNSKAIQELYKEIEELKERIK